MLFLLTVLASPFFPQEGIIVENSYFREQSSENENDDAITFLAYNSAQNPSGKVMTVSKTSNESGDEANAADQEVDGEINAEDPIQNEEDKVAIEETKTQQISRAMEKEFGEMRMIQLADSIAGDMGIIMKVRLEG